MMMKNREGMTLAEMLVALTIFGILFAATLGFLDQQTKVFNKGTTQMEALQNMRYSMSILEKDLNTVGSNLSPEQPFMVYADTHVVAYNADFSSNVNADPYAVYVDTAMNDLMANAVRVANQFTIPRTSVVYPNMDYLATGENSHAETIMFYFEPDTSTYRADDYLLYRKVNNQASDMIARSILKQPGKPFFEYHRRVSPVGLAPYLELVPAAQLPLRHTVPIHGSPGDTTVFAGIDLLRAIKVNYRTTDNTPAPNERIYTVSRTIALPNAGQKLKKTCGDAPLLGSIGFTATRVPVGGGAFGARLTWNRATDEGNGERDVMRYVIYRSIGALGPFTEPYLSIPAGSTSYDYTDSDVTPLVSYYYAIAAQDCTPSLSSITSYAVPVIP